MFSSYEAFLKCIKDDDPSHAENVSSWMADDTLLIPSATGDEEDPLFVYFTQMNFFLTGDDEVSDGVAYVDYSDLI